MKSKTKQQKQSKPSNRSGGKGHLQNPVVSEVVEGVVTIKTTPEQMKKILEPEPEFKKASEIDPEIERLKFDNGKLRTRLALFESYVEYEGNLYLIQVDPLNKLVKMLNVDSEEEKAKIREELKNE
jgi:hypothetical protein